MIIATVGRFIYEVSKPANAPGTDVPETNLRGLLQGLLRGVSRYKGLIEGSNK